MSCGRTQEFLATAGVSPKLQVDAKKNKMGADEARALLNGSDQIYIAKGQKVLHFHLNHSTNLDEIVALMLGPTGNLRAPTVRQGRTLVVGFNKEAYQELFA